jgi:hypothetical protein
MHRQLMTILFSIAGLLVHAGEIKYPVNGIPEKMLKNANMVKRTEEVHFEIINTGETILRKKYALTIKAGSFYRRCFV